MIGCMHNALSHGRKSSRHTNNAMNKFMHACCNMLESRNFELILLFMLLLRCPWQVLIKGRIPIHKIEAFFEELRSSRSRTCTAALLRCPALVRHCASMLLLSSALRAGNTFEFAG